MTTWRKELTDAMTLTGETLESIESTTLTDEQMDKKFDDTYGGTEVCPFTVWTKDYVYFPMCYDGLEWVGSVARNPDGKPTGHQGGG